MTFSSPSWRSLNPLKGSLNHPKKVTKNCQVYIMFIATFSPPSHPNQVFYWKAKRNSPQDHARTLPFLVLEESHDNRPLTRYEGWCPRQKRYILYKYNQYVKDTVDGSEILLTSWGNGSFSPLFTRVLIPPMAHDGCLGFFHQQYLRICKVNPKEVSFESSK